MATQRNNRDDNCLQQVAMACIKTAFESAQDEVRNRFPDISGENLQSATRYLGLKTLHSFVINARRSSSLDERAIAASVGLILVNCKKAPALH